MTRGFVGNHVPVLNRSKHARDCTTASEIVWLCLSMMLCHAVCAYVFFNGPFTLQALVAPTSWQGRNVTWSVAWVKMRWRQPTTVSCSTCRGWSWPSSTFMAKSRHIIFSDRRGRKLRDPTFPVSALMMLMWLNFSPAWPKTSWDAAVGSFQMVSYPSALEYFFLRHWFKLIRRMKPWMPTRILI